MKSAHALWLATSEVEEHFSLMGGANRQTWMVDSHILLYVAVEASRVIGRDVFVEYPDAVLVAEALGARRTRICEVLNSLSSTEDAQRTIAEYASLYDSKLVSPQRCESWSRLVSEQRNQK